jgi:hypothetical protein
MTVHHLDHGARRRGDGEALRRAFDELMQTIRAFDELAQMSFDDHHALRAITKLLRRQLGDLAKALEYSCGTFVGDFTNDDDVPF